MLQRVFMVLLLIGFTASGACQCEPAPCEGDADCATSERCLDGVCESNVPGEPDGGAIPDGGAAASDAGAPDGGIVERCGDGVLTGAEVCDDGVNDGAYNGCAPDCSSRGAYCGDGAVSDAEVCDDGVNNGAYNGCAPDCSSRGAYCGDGAVSDAEVCDDGVNDGAYNGCAPDCASRGAYCGDGAVSDAEVCDDGVNDGAYNGCAPDCASRGAYCGDGAVSDAEVCDDGVNDGAYNGCAPDCQSRPAYCGDSVMDAAFGEVCDDGVNDGAYEGCAMGCAALGPYCGDGALDFASGELCDDGANTGTQGSCPVQCDGPPILLAVKITEVMYHPVKEDGYDEPHEFVELYNASAAPVTLAGWSIAGGIDYTFAPEVSVPGETYFIIAKNRVAFLAEYPLVDSTVVYGDFTGQLGNGGDDFQVLAPTGAVSDEIDYNDDEPWPTAADGLGAGSGWLDASLLPVSDHQYRGHSLERVDVNSDTNAPANWVISPLDAPTPAAPNAAAQSPVPVQPLLVRVMADGAQGLVDPSRIIHAGDAVRFEVQLSGPLSNVQVAYWIDDLSGASPAPTVLPLLDDGTGGDSVAGDFVFTAVAAPAAERTLFRYEVRGERGMGVERISPRAGEPYAAHAYYITPDYGAFPTRTYDILIDPAAWGTMYTNIDNGRVDGCALRPEWNAQVPAVFVYEGHVIDVRARYQGSRYQRFNGVEVPWAGIAPAAPSPLKALSWRIAFPRYDRFDKRSAILLNKMNQACAGLSAQVVFDMMELVNLPAPPRRDYARMNVNGEYYNYVLELDRMGEFAMERYEAALAGATGEPEAPVGHLHKATGSANEGPYRRAEGNPISEATCEYSIDDHYRYSYDRKTNEFEDYSNIIALIEGLAAADAAGPAALRAFATDNFDVDRMLDFLVVRQFHAPWDDDNHNWFAYQSRVDARWFLLPWDNDQVLGTAELDNMSRSFSPLDIGNPDYAGNSLIRGNFNQVKYLFLKAYNAEYVERLRTLTTTTFHPTILTSLLDDAWAHLDVVDAQNGGAGMQCDAQSRYDTINAFFTDRTDFVRAWPDPARENLAASGTVTTSSGVDAAQAADNVVLEGNFFQSAAGDLLPYWQVDLGGLTDIASVHVTTRINCCDDELDYNLLVEILDGDQNPVYTHPVFNPWNGVGAPSDVRDPEFLEVNLAAPVSGRFVRVSKAGFADPTYGAFLQLAEVRVSAP